MNEQNNTDRSYTIKVKLSQEEYRIYNMIAKDLREKDAIKEPTLEDLVHYAMRSVAIEYSP